MLIQIQKQFDERRLRQAEREMPKAVAAAINKVATQGRTQLVRFVRNEYAVTARAVREAVSIQKANQRKLEATLKVRGAALPLVEFRARQTASGVTIQIKKGQRKQLKGAFLAESRYPTAGHPSTSVMKRKQKPRLPIKKYIGPYITDLIAARGVGTQLEAFMAEKFPEVLQNQIQWRMDKASSVSKG